MELVEGETLAERLKRGPSDFAEALRIARDVADALEAAHDGGVIHRDLKPPNIKLTPDGRAIVLDFGLAKTFSKDSEAGDGSSSPTLSMRATQAGVILGTAAYMSPEQARGGDVDKRADIFAFGVVLFEMLTGRRPFQGATASDVLASVLKTEPDWSQLPPALDERVDVLMRRCLKKEVRDRRRDIGDVRAEIETIIATPDASALHAPRPQSARWGWVLTAAILGVVAGLLLARSRTSAPVSHLAIPIGASDRVALVGRRVVALSPDGRKLVYNLNRELVVRALDEAEPTPLSGTQEARGLAFSPDGEWVAFYAEGYIKKAPVNGGPPVTLVASDGPIDMSWAMDDTILYRTAGGIARIPSSGGEPEIVIAVDDRTRVAYPTLLPDRDTVLFTLWGTGGGRDSGNIVVQSSSTGERKILIDGGSDAHYVPTGHIVYALGSNILAVAFDLDVLEIRGAPRPVVEGVWRNETLTGGAQYTFARTGNLAYLPRAQSHLTIVDREGISRPLSVPAGRYGDLELSPNGDLVAVERDDDIWIHDIARATTTRFTVTQDNHIPVWSEDGQSLFFRSQRTGSEQIFRKQLDGSGLEQLTTGAGGHRPDSASREVLIFHAQSPPDLWVLPLREDASAYPFLKTSFSERRGTLAPDGRWLAYISDESGHNEIYVVPFPGPGPKIQISTDGGRGPRWSQSGNELFYRNDAQFMAVRVDAQGSLTAGSPRILFENRFVGGRSGGGGYSPMPDGRFIANESPNASHIAIVLNWFDELERLVPTK